MSSCALPPPGVGRSAAPKSPVCVCVEGECWLSPLQPEILIRCNKNNAPHPLVVGDTVRLDAGHTGAVSLRAVVVQLQGPAFGVTAWLEVVRASRGHNAHSH